MGAVGFIDIRVSIPLGYRKSFIGLPTRLLEMESNRKATF
jgi:hypothetical protein